jgi:hypothetical protein
MKKKTRKSSNSKKSEVAEVKKHPDLQKMTQIEAALDRVPTAMELKRSSDTDYRFIAEEGKKILLKSSRLIHCRWNLGGHLVVVGQVNPFLALINNGY